MLSRGRGFELEDMVWELCSLAWIQLENVYEQLGVKVLSAALKHAHALTSSGCGTFAAKLNSVLLVVTAVTAAAWDEVGKLLAVLGPMLR